MDDQYVAALREGYRAGEMERIALATANSDLRSDLLAAQQLIKLLEEQNQKLKLELLTAHSEMMGLYDD